MLLAAILLLSSANGTHLWPGAIATEQVAYLPALEGGIQAVGLEDGNRIWITKGADWPLETVGDVLIAVGHHDTDKQNDLDIVCMRRSDGTVTAHTTVSLALPPRIAARLSYDQPNEFAVESGINQSERVSIQWRAAKANQIGIARNPAFPQPSPVQVFGTLVIDPVTSTVVASAHGVQDIGIFPKFVGVDPIDPLRSILWPPVSLNQIEIYPAEKSNIKDLGGGGREVVAVALDTSTHRMLWQLPIAMRHVQRLRM